MDTLFDYLKWRRDLTFKADPFNEVDALILCRFAYLPLDALAIAETTTIAQACAFLNERISEYTFPIEEDRDLIKSLINNERLGQLRIAYYQNDFDEAAVRQFAAVTIFLDPKTVFVAFRGTDNTLLGWKEDFLLTFNDLIPSHLTAKAYLQRVLKENPVKAYVGGHSKGGNLAMYAASFLNKRLKKQLLTVFAFDAPGFTQKIITHPKYLATLPKIVSYMPQSSFVGIMLEHKETVHIIHSSAFGPRQHDLYSWEVALTRLHYLPGNTLYSQILDHSFEDYLHSLSKEKREQFVDVLFEIAEAGGYLTLSAMHENLGKSVPAILKKAGKLNKEDFAILFEVFKTLAKAVASNTGEEIAEEIAKYRTETADTLRKKIKNALKKADEDDA